MKKPFEVGEILPLIGNEAIALGAIESGVGFVSTYPGTPASEIGNVLYKLKDAYGFLMEFSTNEIVALEAGAGAAFSGVPALVAMKHFGANVAMDALIPIAYTKPRNSLVIVIADDPGCHSSAQSEQDSRVFIKNLFLPTLEPSTPQEAKTFIKLAFQISKNFEKPVIVRTTTRVSHQTGPVRVEKFKKIKKVGRFIKDVKRFNTSTPGVLEQKRELINLGPKFEAFFEKTNLNPFFKGTDKKKGVVCSGVGCLYVWEVFEKLKLKIDLLKIDTFYPLPSKKITEFLKGKEKILVVEEGLGLIEDSLKVFAHQNNFEKIKIFGKDIIEPVNELNTLRVLEAFAKVFGTPFKKPKPISLNLEKRTPRFCPGCPYWAIFGAIQRAVDKRKVIFTGDIGCYMMGYFPPFQMQDTLLCMGSSVSLAHGISKVTNQKVIAMIGDSTLFHAGLPGIINIVNNVSDPLIIVFDNQITAMTGRQPHPGTPLKYKKHDGKAEIDIEKLLRVLGIKNIEVLDPISENQKLVETIKKYINKKQASAIICKHPCLYIEALEDLELRY